MATQGNFMIHLSVLYRNTQKYFDRVMEKYNIGWGQLMFLFFINENEGITMQEVTKIGEVDKGTTSKSIRTLQEHGYVTVSLDPTDKRVRRLYTTEKAAGIMTALYEYRNRFRNEVFADIDARAFEDLLEDACRNSRTLEADEKTEALHIGYMEKLTLTAVEDHTACRIYMAGCTLKCPFCPNKDLVFVPEDYIFLEQEEVMTFLQQHNDFLDAVCISGGEPLMQEGIVPFIEEIKEMGYFVKLETNGTIPDRLKTILSDGIVDEISLEIKNSCEQYARTTGLSPDAFNCIGIEESIALLKSTAIKHTFRTIISPDTHTVEDLIAIAKQVGDGAWEIIPYTAAYTDEEIGTIMGAISQYAPHAKWRRTRR